MSDSKEFQGKSLDAAIKEACDYYGVPREKLEIEIVNDAKSGIFGLVGAKKASIRASKVNLDAALKESGKPTKKDAENGQSAKSARQRQDLKDKKAKEDMPATDKSEQAKPSRPASKKASAPEALGQETPTEDNAQKDASSCDDGAAPSARGAKKTTRETSRRKPSPEAQPGSQTSRQKSGQHAAHSTGQAAGQPAGQSDFPLLEAEEGPRGEDLPTLVIDDANLNHVLEVVCETVTRLATPIAGDINCSAELRDDRVAVTIDSPEAQGLLVGREGQTLAAIHYLAARMAAKKLGGSLPLHIDAGNYRERQEEKLKELALNLAAKAKATGRSQSTRPLSAYQRRIIHIALENDQEIQTHSKGEGSQRRVVFQPRKNGEHKNPRQGNGGRRSRSRSSGNV